MIDFSLITDDELAVQYRQEDNDLTLRAVVEAFGEEP